MSLLDQGFGRTATDAERDRGRTAGQSGELAWQRFGRGAGKGTQEEPQQNVGQGERAVSLAAGAIVTLMGVSRRSLPGLLVAGVGAGLLYRGATGHCPAYDRLGINTLEDGQDGDTEEQIAKRGIHVENAFLINRPAEELYRYWRNFENLPRIMTHLESVSVIDDRRSHWAARLPRIAGGKRLEWDAEVTRDDPNALIAWRSLPGSDIDTTGQIRFGQPVADRGTEVHVFMEYVPPGGMLARWIAPLFSKASRRMIREDLRNFKRIMEVGEIPTIIGQPHGTCAGQGERYTESPW
jgi:uncharacterized membrane protein